MDGAIPRGVRVAAPPALASLQPAVTPSPEPAVPPSPEPAFDRPVPDGGYFWHYVDGISDDGATAVVIIALLGNPFSPSYARARRRGPAPALAFSSMNVALYHRQRGAWSLAERAVSESARAASSLTIGQSTMHVDGDRLVVDIDERTTPLGSPVRGTVILHPEAETTLEHVIDDRGEHRWWPLAPLARIEVDFPEPGVRFSGHGYHDANAGDVPIESSFEHWSWSRARTDLGAMLTYDVACANGAQRSLGFRVSPNGEVAPLRDLTIAPVSATTWRLGRDVRVDAAAAAARRAPRVVRTLEDGPFYARTLVETEQGGQKALAMHESLAAHRLRSGLVQVLTRFRMRTFR